MHPAKHSIDSDFNNNIHKSVISNHASSTGLMTSTYNGNQNGTVSINKQIKIGNYILGATIGKGNSAVVKLATHSLTRQKVAIKIFDKNGLDNEKQVRLRREIDSMKQLKHQHIIKLYEIMETSKLICLVTEYASNGELYNHILRKKRLSEREARSILKQIVAAVHFCHFNQIVHRDIKVENLLLDSNFRVKLADFGFSTHFDEGDLLDVWCGSPPYCAPELYLARPYDGPKVDIWSLGVVLYVLVCGYLPFEAQSFNLLKSQVVNGAYKLPFFLSEDCKNLINGILQIDPERRFSIEEIINHRWLKFDNECLILLPPPPAMSMLPANENDCQPGESILYQEFRKLIAKIEKISIKDSKIDDSILKEIAKYGIDPDDVINSIRNNEFDSNAGIYFLLESKHANQSDISSSSSGQHIFRLKSEARSDDVISNSGSDSTYESQACKINVFGADDHLGLGAEDTVDEDQDEDDGGDQMIEELGRQYLNRHNSIRRHTIGTNTNEAHFNSDLMKSTECLPMLNEIVMAEPAGATSTAAVLSGAVLLHEEAMRNSLLNSNLVNGVLNNSLLNSLLINSVPRGSVQAHLSGSYVKDLGIFGTKTQSEVAQNLNNHLPASTSHLSRSSHVNPFMTTAHQFSPPSYSPSQPDAELLNVNANYANYSSPSTSPSSKQQPPVKQKNNFKLTTYPAHAKQPKLNSMNQYLSPPNIAGRRASDGGSNISLFNQFYSLKNPYGNNCNIYQSNASSKQSRGSITSGIPIFNMNPLLLEQSQSNTICEMFNPNDPPSVESDERSGGYENTGAGNRYSFGGFQNRLNRVASLSSEDDDNLKANSNAADSITRFHRKSKSRHEPYLDPSAASFSNSSTGNILSNAGFVGKLSASRSREQSISGAVVYQSNYMGTSKDMSSPFVHRASEPNPLDLIFAHRAHLEKIYNQSVRQGDVSLAKELKILQQENPSIDERTKVKLQNQHENVMNNLSKMRTAIDVATAAMLNVDRNGLSDKFQTPKSSLSSTTSEDSTSNGGSFSTLRNNSTSPTNLLNLAVVKEAAAATSSDITLMLNNNLDAISLVDQPSSPLTISDLLGASADLMSNSNESISQQQQQLSTSASNQLMNPSALQMIQEEQNEIVLTSTSLTSSTPITPRMNSSAHLNPDQGFVYDS